MPGVTTRLMLDGTVAGYDITADETITVFGNGLQVRDVLYVEEGSLYPALHRMEQEGWLTPAAIEYAAKLFDLTAVTYAARGRACSSSSATRPRAYAR